MAQLSADERHNQTLIITISVLLLSFCFGTFALRLWARKMMKLRLGADDYSMMFVLLACTAMSTSDLVGIRFGSGIHSSKLSGSDVLNFQINLYIFMLLWAIGTTSVRVSILLFYWRVFAVRHFRRAVLGAGIGITSAGIALLLVFAFQCNPPSKFWNEEIEGTCINQVSFYLAGGAVNLLEDVTVLILPMPLLWSLKASVSKKIALSFLFLLGGFVCITSIFRILAVGKIIPTDFTWSNVEGGVWSTIEVEVGCICANLPHLRPLLAHYFPNRLGFGSSHAKNSQSGGFRSKQRSEGFERITDPRNLNKEASISTLHETGSEIELNGRVQPFDGIHVQTKFSQSVEETGSIENDMDAFKPITGPKTMVTATAM